MKTVILIVVTLLTIAFVCLVAGPALTASAGSPSASPSPTVTPAPIPASAALIHHALKVRATARARWREWNSARSCFKLPSRAFRPAHVPRRAETASVWLTAASRWRSSGRAYRAKFRYLLDRMRHPGGSSNGTRWAPLARLIGWPERTIHTLTGMIMFESSGRERALNTAIDCTGLAQIWPGHVTHRLHLSWSAAIRWLMVGENNLRQALNRDPLDP